MSFFFVWAERVVRLEQPRSSARIWDSPKCSEKASLFRWARAPEFLLFWRRPAGWGNQKRDWLPAECGRSPFIHVDPWWNSVQQVLQHAVWTQRGHALRGGRCPSQSLQTVHWWKQGHYPGKKNVSTAVTRKDFEYVNSVCYGLLLSFLLFVGWCGSMRFLIILYYSCFCHQSFVYIFLGLFRII